MATSTEHALAANKSLARRICEVFSEGDIEALPELVTGDYLNHNRMPGTARAAPGWKR